MMKISKADKAILFLYLEIEKEIRRVGICEVDFYGDLRVY